YLLETANGSSLFGAASQLGATKYGAFAVNALRTNSSGGAQYAAYTVLINTTSMEAAPTLVTVLNSALYNWVFGSNASITAVNAPLPFTKNQGVVLSTIISFVAVLFIVIAFSFIPSSFAVFIVREKEI